MDGSFAPVFTAAGELLRRGGPAFAAIDGRCGSGKTRLAALLAERFGCRTVHMDDFYLPLDRRTPDWEKRPGGNMDFQRLEEEVLRPARAGTLRAYRPYDCRSGVLRPPVELPDSPLLVLEGSYSLHPGLDAPWGLKVFLTCSRKEQERRLRAREGDRFHAFVRRWMPMEERYYLRCALPGPDCLVIDTGLPPD